MLCIPCNTKFLLLRLIVLFRANCLEEFTGLLQFNTYITMWERNVRHAELRAIFNIQSLKALVSATNRCEFHIQECLPDALQYQHILLGYCHSPHPWATSELKDSHLGSTLCVSAISFPLRHIRNFPALFIFSVRNP